MIEIKTPDSLIPAELLVSLGVDRLNELAKTLAASAWAKWIKLAQGDSSHMRFDYVRGIQEPQVARGTAIISLVGEVPNLMEHGDSGQDMRQTLLGDQVPVVPRGTPGKHEAAAGGFYRAIPFRHATPGASAGVVGQEMGSPYQAVMNAKKLGDEVYREAKKLAPSTSEPGKGAGYGGRLKPGMAPKLQDHHKTDIYAGMIREEKPYEEATQSQYFTFRTISTHVTDEAGNRVAATVGWQREPIQARNYAQEVADFVAKIATDAAQALLEAE